MAPVTAATHLPRRIATAAVVFTQVGLTTAVPDLAVTIPPHTAMDPHATAGLLTEAIHRHVLMFLPDDISAHDYTVAVALPQVGADPALAVGGTATITEVLHGADRVRRQPRTLGAATITADLAPVERARRR